MLESEDLIALLLTLRLALVSTIVLMLISLPLAWWLSQSQSRFKTAMETLVALPLVLPPTVLGFYLLLMLGANGPLASMGLTGLAFSFSGLVIGSVIYSLPFVVQPLQNAFISMGRWPIEVAASLGAGPLDRFFSVVLPMARRGLLTAATLGFAHTLGEFGVVLMIGGNIPGETRVVSVAIYEHVEALEYARAHMLSLLLVLTSFVILYAVYRLNRSQALLKIGAGRP